MPNFSQTLPCPSNVLSSLVYRCQTVGEHHRLNVSGFLNEKVLPERRRNLTRSGQSQPLISLCLDHRLYINKDDASLLSPKSEAKISWIWAQPSCDFDVIWSQSLYTSLSQSRAEYSHQSWRYTLFYSIKLLIKGALCNFFTGLHTNRVLDARNSRF